MRQKGKIVIFADRNENEAPQRRLDKPKLKHEEVNMGDTEVRNSLIADYYAAHRNELLAYVSRMLRHDAVAEDIVQDAFLRLLCSDKMVTPVTLPNLVHSIAHNLAVNYWRRRCVAAAFEQSRRSGTKEGDCEADVATVYNATEIVELLEQGMARLTAKQREIYCMNVYGGMKVAEISDELRVSYKSVEHRLGDARREVRSYMRRMLAS